MNIEAEKIENAVESLKEAMRADDLVTEAAYFHLSDSAFREVQENAKKHIAKAIEKMKEIPMPDKQYGNKWNKWYYGCFPPLLDANNSVPCSILHLCIHDIATGRFKRPNPLPEIKGELTDFFEEVSDEQKAEHEFLCKFADYWQNLTDRRISDAMP